MKIKQDFVTNSSSTSYLISLPIKINELDNVLLDFLNQLIKFKLIKNKDDLEQLGYEEEDFDEVEYNEIIYEIENNYVFSFTIDYGLEVNVEKILHKFNGKLIFGD